MAAGLDDEFKEYVSGMLPQAVPCCLYEHMVKRIAPYTARGVLWYQGESDDVDGRQELYKEMLKAVISDWRKCWNDEELSFLTVQLPGWESWLDLENHDYITIRKGQEDAVKETSHTYLCSISDAGEPLDIHPKDKKIVGERLALLARGMVYGKDILCNAPVPDKIEIEDEKVILSFQNAGNGLYIKGESLNAAKVLINGMAVDFQSKTEGAGLILILNEKAGKDIRVEFAQQKWYQVNLYNEAGIPAIPFVITA